ncbi:sugar phosphate isomerase/epimerase family protein [Microbulbifer variabilis]|uniref:sugar phosphate isomerase/epimerase family protein n=1 Tax=Microbulbifer variabilis TaxID=266805 RepID=UPI0003705B6B|nr:sugar phosphate isomerase/epimerase family protein [Microbulbifer variabilis]
MTINRRRFLANSTRLAALGLAAPFMGFVGRSHSAGSESFFKISLAQWSLHRQLRSGTLKVLDFPVKTRKVFGIGAVEYVNQFFKDQAKDLKFLTAMRARAEDHNVRSLLIMVDGEGDLGDPDKGKRKQAIENHYKWIEAAKHLDCHSVRVNAAGQGSREEVAKASVEGLRALSEFAQDFNINVIVENHGGYSSNGEWLSQVLHRVDMPNCGSLPDFGNFGDYDRYLGVQQLMPFAQGISAKSFEFDSAGSEINTDFARMLRIIRDAGYRGYVGIEFEGPGDEDHGIMATKRLLEHLGRKMEVST